MATYVCCLSALPPQPSPNRLLVEKSELQKLTDDIVSEISPSIDPENVHEIVLDALQQLNDIEAVYGTSEFFWKYYTTAFAIGFFGPDIVDGDALEEARIAGGRGAQKRHVADFDSELVSNWNTILLEGSRTQDEVTYVSPYHNHPNFFILEGCYRYLEAWINLASAPPRSETFADDQSEDMELHEELWDIINSFTGDEGRSRTDGRLGFMDYSPAGDIFVPYEYFNFYSKNRRVGSPNLSKALARGLREKDLMRAVMLDFNCWSTMRPDGWPKPSSASLAEPSSLTSFPEFSAPRSAHPFWTDYLIPSGVLEIICSYLPLLDLQQLSATCWSLHTALGKPGYLDRALRNRAPQWMFPVASLPGETERANEAARAWLRQGSDDEDPFSHGDFPWYAFTRACWSSMSMMNRHRMWVQVKQLEKVWRKYRNEGGLGARKGKTLWQIKQLSASQ